MKSFRECVQEAEEKKVAIGHFNISDLETLWGIWRAAKNLNVPVIIGLSEGERGFVGLRQAKALVESLREEFDFPIFINADHSYSYESFKDAIDARYDAAIFDGTKKSIDENIKETKRCVSYARSVDPEIVTEGELGYIGSSSKLLDELPENVGEENMASPEESKRYVSETGVDLFAPAIGNVHGMFKNVPEPRLNIPLLKSIKDAVQIPLVLHGASGNTKEDLKSAIEAGISIVHVNTEIRVAWKEAVSSSISNNESEIAPYKIMKPVVVAIEKTILEKLKIFNNL